MQGAGGGTGGLSPVSPGLLSGRGLRGPGGQGAGGGGGAPAGLCPLCQGWGPRGARRGGSQMPMTAGIEPASLREGLSFGQRARCQCAQKVTGNTECVTWEGWGTPVDLGDVAPCPGVAGDTPAPAWPSLAAAPRACGGTGGAWTAEASRAEETTGLPGG